MASLNVELALANDRDARPLALLARVRIEGGGGGGYRPPRIAALIRDTDTVTLVARTHAQPIGFAVMRYGDERAHLILLAVEREHQRRGIGRRLIEWLLESAYVAGIASVHIELRAANAPAYAFYRALGFSETIRVPGYYRGRESALRMIRMLRVARLPQR